MQRQCEFAMKHPPLSHYSAFTFAMCEAISGRNIDRVREAYRKWVRKQGYRSNKIMPRDRLWQPRQNAARRAAA